MTLWDPSDYYTGDDYLLGGSGQDYYRGTQGTTPCSVLVVTITYMGARGMTA